MYELRFSASQHHIPPVPLGHSTLINPAAAEKVMQEPHFGAFLHHFLSNPQKAARIRGAPPEPAAEPAPKYTSELNRGAPHPGRVQMKRDARRGVAPLRASLLLIIIPKEKELTTNASSAPFRRQF